MKQNSHILSNNLYNEKYENHCGYNIDYAKHLDIVKRKNYYVIKDYYPGGDQPKSLIKLYEYGKTRKNQPKKWGKYLAKFPRKWYPVESITEHLLSIIGELMLMDMAKSKLVFVNNHVRLLSCIFTKQHERLLHGAEIYASYLNDEAFISEIDKKK